MTRIENLRRVLVSLTAKNAIFRYKKRFSPGKFHQPVDLFSYFSSPQQVAPSRTTQTLLREPFVKVKVPKKSKKKMSNAAVIIRQTSEFFTTDYNSLFPDGSLPNITSAFAGDSLFKHFASPRVPILAVLFYLMVSKKIFYFIRETFQIQPKGAVLQWITILHSAILAIYSGWTCYNTAVISMKGWREFGFYGTLCDREGTLWFQEGLGYWITLFYLSKFYEFIDTW